MSYGYTLFLGCVPNHSTDESIAAHFGRFGRVTKALSKNDRGFGFVTFETQDGANAALSMPRQILDGQQIDVRNATGKGGGGSSGGKGGGGPGTSDKIFVGGLPIDCDDDQLREHFSAYGTVVDATVMKYPDSGRSRCFGFIQYDNQASVERVITDYASHHMNGKWVEVKRSVARDKITPPPQKPKGGGRGDVLPALLDGGDGKGGGDVGGGDKGGCKGQGSGPEETQVQVAATPENNGLDVMSILAAAAYVSGYGAYPSLAGYPGLGGYAANPAAAYAAFGVTPPGSSGGGVGRPSGSNRAAPY